MDYQYYNDEQQKQGSIAAGLIGALAGALIGAAVWAFAALVLEIISALIGFLIGILASKGYDLLKGRQGVAKLVCVIIAVVVGVVVGTGVTYGWVFHQEYLDRIEGFSEELIAANPELDYWAKLYTWYSSDILANLGQGLLFAALGCIGLFRDLMAKPASAPAAADVSAASVPDYSAAQVPLQTSEENQQTSTGSDSTL